MDKTNRIDSLSLDIKTTPLFARLPFFFSTLLSVWYVCVVEHPPFEGRQTTVTTQKPTARETNGGGNELKKRVVILHK